MFNRITLAPNAGRQGRPQGRLAGRCGPGGRAAILPNGDLLTRPLHPPPTSAHTPPAPFCPHHTLDHLRPGAGAANEKTPSKGESFPRGAFMQHLAPRRHPERSKGHFDPSGSGSLSLLSPERSRECGAGCCAARGPRPASCSTTWPLITSGCGAITVHAATWTVLHHTWP